MKTLEITREILRAQNYGMPKAWAVSPEDYWQIGKEISVRPIAPLPASMNNGMKDITIYGVPLVVIPFTNDPKFKTFRSMASLAGAKIHYEIGDDKRVIQSASFATDAGSWCYMPSRGGANGSVGSRLYQSSCQYGVAPEECIL